jgi:hypothetical protein
VGWIGNGYENGCDMKRRCSWCPFISRGGLVRAVHGGMVVGGGQLSSRSLLVEGGGGEMVKGGAPFSGSGGDSQAVWSTGGCGSA